MKKLLISLICSFLFIGIFISKSNAQKTFELQVMGAEKEHFISIKGKEIEADKVYTYMFSQQTKYKFIITSEKKDLHVKILNADKKEVATNYNPDKKTYEQTFVYKCGKTGMYYLEFVEHVE